MADNKNYKDKRRAPRVEVNATVTIHTFVQGKTGAGESAELKDISPRGIKLVRRDVLVKGAIFALEVPAMANRPARRLICRVAHCRYKVGEFHVGAEFINISKPAVSEPSATTQSKNSTAAALASMTNAIHAKMELGREEVERIRRSILG